MIEIAHVINDKWDAVWEMPFQVFLALLRYRNDKAELEAARARQARNNAMK